MKDQIVSQAEQDRMIAEHLAQHGETPRTRFVPRNLELRMGRAAAAKWLNDRDAEASESESATDEED